MTDGQMVYAWFGTGQLVALDTNGTMIWQRHLGQEFPLRCDLGPQQLTDLVWDLLILLCDHEPASYCSPSTSERARSAGVPIAARVACPTAHRSSWTRPAVGADRQFNGERVDAYDPRTGTLLWFTGGANRFPIPMPVFHDGLIYMSRGYRSGPYMAVRPGGRGDISKSHVVWESATGAPYISSLVYDAGLIYMATDVGAIALWTRRQVSVSRSSASRSFQPHRLPGTARSTSSARPAKRS